MLFTMLYIIHIKKSHLLQYECQDNNFAQNKRIIYELNKKKIII